MPMLAPALAFALAACDSGAVVFPTTDHFSHAQIVSAWPARRAEGRWKRVCDAGPVDGLVTNIELVATGAHAQQDDDEVAKDPDLSIRPGDIIDMRIIGGKLSEDIHLDAPGSLGLAIECVDPLPDDDTAACGGTTPAASLERVGWFGENDKRGTPHEILVLIDQSGSMGGLVDAADHLLEPQANAFGQLPDRPGDVASDKLGSRFRALRSFIMSLGEDDRLGVLAFAEGQNGGADMVVPCAAATSASLADGLDACFGVNHDNWLAPSGVDALRFLASGRSNLWKAIDFAYGWMIDPTRKHVAGAARHIVVLTDGPDTCAGEAQTPGTAPCSTTLAHAVIERIAADHAAADAGDLTAPTVRVDFVQFEAPGYPGRDPRQVEAACVSGGHYRFVSSNAFAEGDRVAQLDAALTQALWEIRLALSGHWELASAVPAWVSDAAAPTGTPPGSMYALSGILTIARSSGLVPADTLFPFDVGKGAGAPSATAWDRRPTVIKPPLSLDE